MSSSRINPDQLAVEVMRQMRDFAALTTEDVKKIVNHVGMVTVHELNETSPRSKNGGTYAKSWAYKKDPDMTGSYRTGRVVYSKKPEYRLPHLLEKSHRMVVRGGRLVGHSKAQPHVAAAEAHAIELTETMLKEAVARRRAGG